MAEIPVIITLWAGQQNMSLDGCNGFNRLMIDPAGLDMIGLDVVSGARKFPKVELVTIEWEGGSDHWERDSYGNWEMRQR